VKVKAAKDKVRALGGDPADVLAFPNAQARGRAVGDRLARQDLWLPPQPERDLESLPAPASKIEKLPEAPHLEAGAISNVRSLHGGPGHINETVMADIDTGAGKHKVVIKPESGMHQGRMRDNITPGHDGVREEAAYWIARILRTPTPAVVQRDTPKGRAIVSAFIPDAEVWWTLRGERREPHGPDIDKDLRSMALLDMVIGNTDRHAGNYMSDGKRVFAIDHGLAFPDTPAAGRVFANFQVGEEYFTRSLNAKELERLEELRVALDSGLGDKMIAGGMERSAVSMMRKRIDRMIERKKFLYNIAEVMGRLN
jgi:hypothetical protein